MSIAAIRGGLGTAAAATGITRGFTEEPESLQPPAYVVGNPTIAYNDTFEAEATYTFHVFFILGRAGGASEAVRGIDGYIDPTSATSFPSKVNVDMTLGGVCESAVVKTAAQFNGGYTIGTDEFAGVAFEVEVMV